MKKIIQQKCIALADQANTSSKRFTKLISGFAKTTDTAAFMLLADEDDFEQSI